MRTTTFLFLLGALFVPMLYIPSTTHAFSDFDTWQLEWELRDLKNELRELNSNRRMDNFRRLSNARSDTIQKLRTMGLQAFYADNEGYLRIGQGDTPQCPKNAHGLMDYCVCDEGYFYDLIGKIKLNSDTPCIHQSNYKSSTEEDVYEEEYEECPAHSQLADDGTCLCDDGYEPDETEQYCARVQYDEPTYEEDAIETQIPFDVPEDAWYRDALASFVESGDIDAYQSFRPNVKATRGEFITLLVNRIGVPWDEISGIQEASFDDVPSWHLDAFEKAAIRGWLKGEGDCLGTHPCYAKPDEPINRAAAAALIIRAYGLEKAGNAPSFSDAPEGQWYSDVITIAASRCVLQGSNGIVQPEKHMNRAEMVVMLHRVAKSLQYPHCG